MGQISTPRPLSNPSASLPGVNFKMYFKIQPFLLLPLSVSSKPFTCIWFLGLLGQNTTNGGAEKTEVYCLPVLEARNLKSKCQQGWFLLRAVREGSAPGLSPWPRDGHPLPTSLNITLLLCVSVSASNQLYWIRDHLKNFLVT